MTRITRIVLAIGVAMIGAAPLSAQKAAARRPISITWLGHAAFIVESAGGTRLLIDPFLTQNPRTPDSLKTLSRYHPTAILVTHSHFDHALDAKAIALASGAPIVASFDWVSSLGIPDSLQRGLNVGGMTKVGDIIVNMVPAMHGSVPDGRPVGYVLQFSDGRTLYDTGDTWIFGDMALIQEIFHPNIVLLNVGGGPFTENPAVGALAIRKYFHPSVIVPMHYGTFPVLADEAAVRAAFRGDARLHVMPIGTTQKF